MTKLKESARQMRSPSLCLRHHKLEQYPKSLYLKSRTCIYKLESVQATIINKRSLTIMNLSTTALGIDIAKAKFDVCLIKQSGKAKHKIFQNTRHGFEQLAVWLNSHQTDNLHACLEATGTYGEPLALFLFEAGFVVSVVNPAAVRAFANAGLSRTKTDKV